jgi:hypothetical protein
MTGGVTLYYQVGERRPIRVESGKWARDAQGRTALEAFGALPIQAMYDRLAAGTEAWRAESEEARASLLAADPGRESRRWLFAFDELVSFIGTFGPLGFDWSRTFAVKNSMADRALRDLDERRTADTLIAMGKAREAARSAARRSSMSRSARDWQIAFPGPGYGMSEVRELRTYPGLSWEERVDRGDDALWQDFLGPGQGGPLWHQQDDLGRILDLVRALSSPTPRVDTIRNAIGRLPGSGRYDAKEPATRDPVGLYWQDAMRPRREPGSRVWAPLQDHPTRVDWPTAGRLALAAYLSEQLSWTGIGVGLDPRGAVRGRWTVGSLMEVIYLQLLEHVEERLDFGVGECPICRGPVLNTRRFGPTRNVAHFGCSIVLRKRRERARAHDVA